VGRQLDDAWRRRVHRLRRHLLRPQLHRQLPGTRHGEGQVDKGKDAIKAFSPDLYHYISHLHIAVSAVIAATGVAVVFLTWFGVRRGHMWAWVGAVTAPVVGLVVALPAHYPWGFATIGHLGLIYLATAIFVAGALLALKGLAETSETGA
jgi:hypothetical protein